MSKKKNNKAIMANKTPDPVVLQHVVVKPPIRKVYDAGDWRKSMVSADSGRVSQLYDLLDDIMLDGILSDAVDKRIQAVTNSDLIFVDRKGKEVTEIQDKIIDSEDFENLVINIMRSRMYGRSGSELDFSTGELVVHRIPEKHIYLEGKCILLDTSDDKGISYVDDPQLLILGTPRNYGLVYRAAQYAIYKRGGFGDWAAQWIELFGMPQRIGKYNSADPHSRKLLEEAMREAGSAQYLVIPKEADVEIRDSNSGNGISYNQFRQACNEEILVTILGQTLTTISGDKGARSLGEVHKAVSEDKYKSDIRYVRRILNKRLQPLLELRGFGVKGGRFVFPSDVEPLSVSDVISLSKIISIPASYVHDKYGIPVPQGDEEIAGERTTREEQPADDPEENEEKIDKVDKTPDKGEGGEDPEDKNDPGEEEKEPKKGKKKGFVRKLADRFFGVAPTQGAGLSLMRSMSSTRGMITLSDEYSIDLSKLLEEALKEVYNEPSKPISPAVFEINNKALQEGIDKVFEEFEFGKKNQAFVDEFKRNTSVWAAFKSHSQTQAMIDALYDEDGNIISFWAWRKKVKPIIGKYNEEWLRTEYNTAVRAARAAVNYRQALETKDLYPNLEYLESTAHEKRLDHLGYVGTILPIDHPWWDDHLPPSEWNCQCSVRPTDKPETVVPLDDGTIRPTFRNNPGKTAQPIKLAEHPYIQRHALSQCPECVKSGYIDGVGSGDLCPSHRLLKIIKDMTRYKDVAWHSVILAGGGRINLPKGRHRQNKNESIKNENVLRLLAKVQNRQFNLLPVINLIKEKNPDAYCLNNAHFIDIKNLTEPLSKTSFQNSVRKANKQGASEVIIDARIGFRYQDLWKGFKSSFHSDWYDNITIVTVIHGNDIVRTYDVSKIKKIVQKKPRYK